MSFPLELGVLRGLLCKFPGVGEELSPCCSSEQWLAVCQLRSAGFQFAVIMAVQCVWSGDPR